MPSIKKTIVSIFFIQVAHVAIAVAADSQFVRSATTTAKYLQQQQHYHHQRTTERRTNEFGLPDGVWTFRGYGFVFDVVDGNITPKEETAISCIPNEGLLQVIKDIQFDGDVANVTVYRFVPYFVLDRTDTYQAGCVNGLTPVKGDPQYVRDALEIFDILDQFFEERYAFFELRGVDWYALTSQARANLTSNSTDDELLEAFKSILGPLDDYHVVVRTETTTYFSHLQDILVQFQEEFEQQETISDLENYTEAQIQTWLEIVGGYMDDDGLNMESSGLIWGRFSGTNVGYMQLQSMPEDVGPFVEEVNAAFLSLTDTDVIVFDNRINPGGSDRGSLFLASHFTSEPFLAFTKHAVDRDAQEVYVEPSDPVYQYNGKVIEIISGSTYSAAETFTLAMAQLPQTTLLGRNTGGSFSDLPHILPNGWSTQVSPEEHISPADGMLYEKVGIPPDISPEADLLPLSEREAGIDSWLELALKTATATNSTTQEPTTQSDAAEVLMSYWTWTTPFMWALF